MIDKGYVLAATAEINPAKEPDIETLVSELDALIVSRRVSGVRVNPEGTLQELVNFSKFLNAVQTEIKEKINAAVVPYQTTRAQRFGL